MLEYKARKQKEKDRGLGRLSFELPMEDLKALKILAIEWKSLGIDESNVSNLVRYCVKMISTQKDCPDMMNNFRKVMKK